MGQIICLMQNNTSLQLRTNQISSTEVVFRTRSAFLLHKHAFMPGVRIVMSNTERGTLANVEYSLQKGTKILVMVYCVLALAFEVMLLCLWRQINEHLLLFLPLGLILFAVAMCAFLFLLSSKKIHRELLSICDERERLKVVFKNTKESLTNRQR